jgi:hypothetical protein
VRLTEVIGAMISVYDDWSPFLINPNFTRNNNIISWPNSVVTRLNNPRIEDVENLISSRQYSFQIGEDDSIIRIIYSFMSNEEVYHAELSYYSSGLENPNDLDYIGWVRLDFDPGSARGVAHTDCHLHLSMFPDSRIPVSKLPTPRQFVEFVISTFYPKIFEEKRLSAQGVYNDDIATLTRVNSDCFDPDNNFCNDITHFKIPSSYRAAAA